jgi:hypothetical protein
MFGYRVGTCFGHDVLTKGSLASHRLPQITHPAGPQLPLVRRSSGTVDYNYHEYVPLSSLSILPVRGKMPQFAGMAFESRTPWTQCQLPHYCNCQYVGRFLHSKETLDSGHRLLDVQQDRHDDTV